MSANDKNVYAESSESPNQLEELYTHVRSLRRFNKGYQAIHLHFSILDRLHQKPHHRRTIAKAFNSLITPYEGKLFWTRSFDLFFICKRCPAAKLEKARIDAIRSVDDSPIIKSYIKDGEDKKLCSWYDLEKEYDKFQDLAEALYNNDGEVTQSPEQPTLKSMVAKISTAKDDNSKDDPKAEVKAKKQKTVPHYEHIFPKDVIPNLGPLELDKLERNLLTMDLFNLIQQQNICVVMDKMTPEVVFTKKYISLKEVNDSVLPGYNISGDKWLFQRLTRTFDSKVMQALVAYKSFPKHYLSINMNVSTILTKEFDQFIIKQKQFSDKPIILEFSLFDIMSDLTEYFIAQKKIEKLGCKICICRMDIQSLYVLDRELMNVDFLKIRWEKDYLTSVSETDKKKVSDAIAAQGKMRVVMSECDSQNAISFGNSIGIIMYQGFEIDRLQGL
jgi:hypothetical protein